MSIKKVTLCVCFSVVTSVSFLAHGQADSPQNGALTVAEAVEGPPPVQSQIVTRIDETKLMVLRGNTHPRARTEFDRGPVDPQLPLERIVLVLKRNPDREAALEAFMARQLDPKSPDFHHWLQPDEFGKLYGPSDADISAITNWLQNHGFSINGVSNGRTFIDFSGNARLVQEAFHTEIHRYNVRGEEHIANNSDPSIPEALSPVVAGILSLHNFFSMPLHRYVGSFHRASKTGGWEPDNPDALLKPMFTVYSGAYELVSPYDFATIYNVLPLWSAGIDGTGQTIAIAGRSDITLSDVATFRSSFGLPAKAPTVIVNGSDPGVPTLDDKLENTLDVEWSGAVAKGAAIKFVTTASTMNTDGAVESAIYIIDNNIAPIMSFSYGECELDLGTAGNAAINSMWQQGAAQGITEFVASGDQGSAGCDGGQASPYLPQYGLAVSGASSTPWNVAVGGTDLQWFNLTGTYWSSSNNGTNLSSALGYIPEVPWNGTCASDDIRMAYGFTTAGANAETTCNEIWDAQGILYGDFVNASGGSGGVSACTTPSSTTVASCSGGYAKPSWQTGTGVPADGKRDVPDVSLFASAGELYSAYSICDSDLGPCNYSVAADAAGQAVGGTSVSSPAMAGIMALVLQKIGGSAQGLANPVFYQLASQQNLSSCNSSTVTSGNSCFFYDITTDNIRVPCATGSPDCTTGTPGHSVGILNGYDATTGYDLATGLGSVNAYNLVNAWFNPSTPTVMTSPAPGSTLIGPFTTFTWTAGTGATGYYLWIGTTFGGHDLVNIGPLAGTSTTVTLPTNGATIYVRLWSVINGTLQYSNYSYTEANVSSAAITSPLNGSTLTGSSTTFTWTAGTGATGYYLWIGTTFGGHDLVNIGPLAGTSTTVTLPTNGATIYVRLWSVINGTLQYSNYSYTEANVSSAAITSPLNGSTLTGSSTTFTWTAGTGATGYYLWIGTTFGGHDLVNIGPLAGTSTTVTLPTNGATIYVRLWSVINGTLQYSNYSYTEANVSSAAITSPLNGSTLTGSSTTFTWTAGTGATGYYLWIGTTFGGHDLVNIGPLAGTSTTVTLPTNGATIYVRLWSVINGTLQYSNYSYTEFH